MATELFVMRMSRLFAEKPVIKKSFTWRIFSADASFGQILGLLVVLAQRITVRSCFKVLHSFTSGNLPCYISLPLGLQT